LHQYQPYRALLAVGILSVILTAQYLPCTVN